MNKNMKQLNPRPQTPNANLSVTETVVAALVYQAMTWTLAWEPKQSFELGNFRIIDSGPENVVSQFFQGHFRF